MKQLFGAVVWNLKATWDLLMFFILTALRTCFPGSSLQVKIRGQNQAKKPDEWKIPSY